MLEIQKTASLHNRKCESKKWVAPCCARRISACCGQALTACCQGLRCFRCERLLRVVWRKGFRLLTRVGRPISQSPFDFANKDRHGFGRVFQPLGHTASRRSEKLHRSSFARVDSWKIMRSRNCPGAPDGLTIAANSRQTEAAWMLLE